MKNTLNQLQEIARDFLDRLSELEDQIKTKTDKSVAENILNDMEIHYEISKEQITS